MKLAVICANGKSGKLITKEALSRGIDVTAVVRGENRSDAKKAIVKDLFDLTKDDLKGFDAVADAFGAWTPDTICDITKAVEQHFKDIDHDPNNADITFENCQARERTQVLMDMANKHNAIVIGTGDLSELALGWATYNGDHMSMYNVNVSIPKTLCIEMVRQSIITGYSYSSFSF